MSNDVWSLGIILVNMATGRNPWKTATPDDPTFQAYLRDPQGFFPSVLPVSSEINDILVRMLHIDQKERITLRELREALEDIQDFYSEDVVFEGGVARCSWEAGLDLECYPSAYEDHEGDLDQLDEPKSAWSRDSHSSCCPRTPDGPSTTMSSAQDMINGANHRSDSSLFPSHPSSPSCDDGIWTGFQSSKGIGMADVLDTPAQNIEDISSEALLDEQSFSTPVFPAITSVSSPCAVGTDEQTGAALSPTQWIPYKGRLHPSSRSSSQSTSSSEPSCVISFARSLTPSSNTSSWSGECQSEYLPGTSIYTSSDFHDSEATNFKQFMLPRRSDLGSTSKDQHRAALSADSRQSSPTAIHGPPLDRSPGGGSTPSTERTWKTTSFSSTRSWFLLGKLFSSSVAE